MSFDSDAKVIYVSGYMCSGKSTIAEGLCNILDGKIVRHSALNRFLLSKIFAEPEQYAFKTQLSVLSSKAISILDCMAKKKVIIVERTLREDIEIFASYFHRLGFIKDEEFEIYSQLAKHFLAILPKPEYVVFCKVDYPAALTRMRLRSRIGDEDRPKDYLEKTFIGYEAISKARLASRVIYLNSVERDFRQSSEAQKVALELGFD